MAFNVVSIATASVVLLFAGTYIFTYLKFQLDQWKFTNAKNGQNLHPPHLPYLLPWIGNAPSFLSTKPHKFWSELFSWYPRSAGSCLMTMGGKSTAVVFDSLAAQYIMKDRTLGRDEFNQQVAINGLGLTKAETEQFYEHHAPQKHDIPGSMEQDKINADYLLKTERVNEMTTEFIEALQEQVSQETEKMSGEMHLYTWLRRLMFAASTKALMGTKILEVIPNLEDLFYQFDHDMLSLFFGLPNFMVRKQIQNRDKALDALVKWHDAVADDTVGSIIGPEEVAWEPIYGSRVNRARQIFYRKKGLNKRAWAGLDLGELFGISSNAIPAAGWMLMHILDSTLEFDKPPEESSLYECIMNEVREAQRSDGTIDIPILVNQPVLLSTLHEVLRLYVDVLISRQVPSDMTLPLNNAPSSVKHASASQPTRSLAVKAGQLLMFPSWPIQNDPGAWQSADQPPPKFFYPYRFLSSPPDAKGSDKPVFSTTPFNGMFIPFGGGKTMCPGRVFAKQEILASVAMMLLTFEFDVLGYVDATGKSTKRFPGLRDTLPGSAVMVASGDLKVRVKRRQL